jgi:hypothetical protein
MRPCWVAQTNGITFNRTVVGYVGIGGIILTILAGAALSLGRYEYPGQGVLGSIVTVRTPAGTVRVAGMQVQLPDSAYRDPPGTGLDLVIVDPEGFRQLLGLLEQELRDHG